jgi:GNAT superfamily N-acetyltransferase
VDDAYDMSRLIARLEHVEAFNALAFALVLRGLDRSWGTESLAVAGGQLVLTGPGLYVNRAIAVGIEEPLRPADVALVIDRSVAVGVPPAVVVSPATHPDSLAVLEQHGFSHDQSLDVTVHVQRLDDVLDPSGPAGIDVVPVSERSLEEWQAVSSLGWGHATQAAQRAADVFARAAQVVDGDGMVLALDASDHRPLGCASLTIHEEVATLGGMSTIPAERGRGVQGALIRHRLRVARDAGCSIATTSTVVGGASERNVQRYGFRATYVRRQYRHG